MGNRKRSRELQKQRDDVDAFRTARTEPRHYRSDVHWRGCGVRRLQIVELPSFEDGELWDIRQIGDQWSLYFSRVSEETSLAHGYDKIEVAGDCLLDYFTTLCRISLPLTPDLNGMGGADGTLWQFTLTGDLCTQINVQWWDDSPREWQQLTKIVFSMLDKFRRLPVVDDVFPVTE